MTLSQLIVAGVLNKSYSSQVSVVRDNGSSLVRSFKCLEQYCFEVVRNAFNDETALTLDGREFQAHAAATGKARSPIVDRTIRSALPVPQFLATNLIRVLVS